MLGGLDIQLSNLRRTGCVVRRQRLISGKERKKERKEERKKEREKERK